MNKYFETLLRHYLSADFGDKKSDADLHPACHYDHVHS